MSTLGETFRAAREGKRVKLAQAAERTKIPVDRLQALEADRVADLPDDVYTRGAIRNYAIYLGVDPTHALTLYREVRPESEKRVPLSVAPTRRSVAVVPAAVATLVVLILILVVLFAIHVIVI